MKQKMVVLGAGSSKDIYGDFYTGAELFHMVVHYFFPQRKSNGIGYVSDMMNQISSNAVANGARRSRCAEASGAAPAGEERGPLAPTGAISFVSSQKGTPIVK